MCIRDRYSRGDDQYPENAPQILVKGKGCYVWDDQNNKYLDYGMALRANILGYANDEIDEAAYQGAKQGNNLTRASVVELNAAELITKIIPGADMVKFAKNGSNVVSACIKFLAKALVYNAWWFEAIMVFFVINFFGNIFRVWGNSFDNGTF